MAAFALLVAVGCGGGGAGGTGTSVAGPKVGLFVTASSGPYSHVWVNVKQVNLVGASGTVNVFKSAAGKSIDLASLNQGGKKLFAALGTGTVPSASFSKVQVVTSSSLTVIPTGASNGSQVTFAGAVGGTKTLTFAKTTMASQPIVANFDLSKWSVSGSEVSGSAQEDNGSDVGSGTQEPEDFGGSVSNIGGTAPDMTFDISEDGSTIHVATDATTVIANSDGSANPVLTNGEKVEIVGTVDPTSLILAATSIKIHVGNSEHANRARGTIASLGTDSFVLNVTGCEGMLPSSTTVNVSTTATTTYVDANGISITSAQFFATAAVGSGAEARGTFDQPSNTLTATTVSLRKSEDGGGSGGNGGNHEVQVKGPVASVDVANNLFTVTVGEYEGALLTKGSTITVSLSGSTHLNGLTLATLQTGTNVEAQGTLSGTTLTATEVNAGGDSGGNGGHGGGNGKGNRIHIGRK